MSKKDQKIPELFWHTVLEDGSTFSGLGGSKIIGLTEEGMKLLDEGLEPNQLEKCHIPAEMDLEDLFSINHEEILEYNGFDLPPPKKTEEVSYHAYATLVPRISTQGSTDD